MKMISKILNRRLRERNRRKNQRQARRLHGESLENRMLLSASPLGVEEPDFHHNPRFAADVNNDGSTNGRDVAAVATAYGNYDRFGKIDPALMTDVDDDGRFSPSDVIRTATSAFAGGAPGDPQVEYTHNVTIGGTTVAPNSSVNVGDVLLTEVIHQDIRQIPQARFPELTSDALKGIVASYNDFVFSPTATLRTDVLQDTGGANVTLLNGADYLLFTSGKGFPEFAGSKPNGDRTITNAGGVQTTIVSTIEPLGPDKFLLYTVGLEVTGGDPKALNDVALVEEGSANNVLDPLANDSVSSTLVISNEAATNPNRENDVLTFVANASDTNSQLVPPEEIIFPTTSFTINGVALGGLSVFSAGNGTASVDNKGTANGDDDQILFTPTPGFAGDTEVVYDINDGVGNSARATITVTVGPVNDAPVNTVPGPQSTDEDITLAFQNLISISDIDAGAANVQVDLTVNNGVVTLPGTSGATVANGGTAAVRLTGTVVQINAELAALTYTPGLNFNGSDTLRVLTNDLGNTGDPGALTDDDSVLITINPINDAPVNVLPSTQFTVEDDTLAFSAASGNAISITDPDADDGSGVQTTLSIVNGTFSIGTPGAAVVTGGGSNNLTVAGSLAAVNAALNTLIYTSVFDVLGDQLVTMVTSDLGNFGSGGVLTDTDSLIITTEPAVRPRARRDVVTATEDTPLVIDVVANDVPNVGFAALVESFGNGSNGTVTLNSQGTPDLTDDTLTYTPNANFNGSDSFTYVVNDTSGTTTATEAERTGTVVVTVNEVNDIPTTTADAVTTAEDTPVVVSVTGNDSAGPTNESGQTLTVTSARMLTGNGSVAVANGVITYTPALNDNGQATFEYTVQDNGTTAGANDFLSATGVVTVTITEVNDDPTGVNDTVTSAEDITATFSIASLLANDLKGPANESGQTLEITSVQATSAQGGAVSISGANVLYTPATNFNGTDTFTYTLSDNGTTNGVLNRLTSTAIVTMTVSEVNDAPTAVADTADIGVKDIVTTYSIANLLANDLKGATNESGQTLSISAVTAVTQAGGALAIVGDNLQYTPPTGYTGPDVFNYTISDDGTTNGVVDPLTAPATLSIEVLDFVPSTFSGGVFHDFDGNGAWDVGENGIGGVAIVLAGTDFQGAAVNITQNTAANGTYDFTNIRPGSYTVTETQPSNMLDGVETKGTQVGTVGEDTFGFSIGILGGVNGSGNLFAERGLTSSMWSIYGRLTERLSMLGEGLIVSSASDWFIAMDGWDIDSLSVTVNGGTVTASTTKGSVTTNRTFINDSRIRKATDAETGEEVLRFDGIFSDFFASNAQSLGENVDDIADEFPADQHPADAVFAGDAWV
jgi:hypothetical protein